VRDHGSALGCRTKRSGFNRRSSWRGGGVGLFRGASCCCARLRYCWFAITPSVFCVRTWSLFWDRGVAPVRALSCVQWGGFVIQGAAVFRSVCFPMQRFSILLSVEVVPFRRGIRLITRRVASPRLLAFRAGHLVFFGFRISGARFRMTCVSRWPTASLVIDR
jgi:hypothetical protein